MWKAIINWINSKAYRCEHNWEKVHHAEVYSNANDRYPYQTKITYVCTKCCESKTIKT